MMQWLRFFQWCSAVRERLARKESAAFIISNPNAMSAIRTKQKYASALRMSAFNPKRTSKGCPALLKGQLISRSVDVKIGGMGERGVTMTRINLVAIAAHAGAFFSYCRPKLTRPRGAR